MSKADEMKNADAMFEELGFDRREELYGKSLLTIKYYNLGDLPEIVFNKVDKTIRTNVSLDTSLLQAINKKSEELEWI